MATTQTPTTCADLEGMSTEEFLAWLLTSCKIDEEEYAPIRRDVQDFMLGCLVGECFDIGVVEKKYPNIYAWLDATSPEVRHE